jgi:type VI protein secretion system component VasK
MRGIDFPPLLPFAAWLAALQATVGGVASAETTARLAGIAGVLGTLTVLIYRLGVWRQEMENTRHNVGAEVKAHRVESTANFERLERRLEAIDHLVSAATEYRLRIGRWQSRTERRLERLELQEVDE